MALWREASYAKTVEPDYEGFREFLITQRQKLGFDTPAALRKSTGRVPGIDDETLRNLEKKGSTALPSLLTFLYLPEFYKVGWVELLSRLMPEFAEHIERGIDLMGSRPWLAELAAAIAEADPVMQQAAQRMFAVSEPQLEVVGGANGGRDSAGATARARVSTRRRKTHGSRTKDLPAARGPVVDAPSRGREL